jgi:hypothetical protein
MPRHVTHKDAFNDLADMADWASGVGVCGIWTYSELGRRWNWHRMTARRFVWNLASNGMARIEPRDNSFCVILLKDQWDSDSVAFQRKKEGFKDAESMLLTVICSAMDLSEWNVRNLAAVNTRRGRGRPSRKAPEQAVLNVWIYLLNTLCGFPAHRVAREFMLTRKAVQSAAMRVEERREQDPAFDAQVTMLEAAYRAALAATKRTYSPWSTD